MRQKEQTVAIDNHNRVSAEQLEKILKLEVESLKDDPNIAHTLPPLMIWGSPGCGKSTIIKNVAKEENIGFIDFRLSQIEPVDLRGLPVPNRDDKSVEWFVSGEFPRDKNSRGILLFDELTAADRSLQVAAYELILDRRLGKLYSLPDGWLVVGAGNKADDHAVSTTMSSALANRFMHVELCADQEEWLTWAQFNNIHPAVTGFISYKPSLLFDNDSDKQNLERGWPSPRAWERVSQICHICKDKSMLRQMVFGLVGNGAGVEFMAFYDINAEFDNILDIMRDPNSTIIIPERADQKYAMCSAMSYLLWRGKDEKDAEARLNGFMRICLKLPSDFATMSMYSATRGIDKTLEKEYAMKIVRHPLFKDFAKKHMETLSKKRNKFVTLFSFI